MNVICSTLNAKYIHTNLAIRLLKAYVSPEFEVLIKEYTLKDPVFNIVSDLFQQNPTVIGFSCYIWNIEETIKVISYLKKVNPSLLIVLGGPEVTYDTSEWMQKIPEVDFIVSGDGEYTFKRLLSEIEANGDFKSIPGITFRNEGQVVSNPQSNELDIKSIPSPYRFEEDIPHLSKRITYFETSRGCPFTCLYCQSSIEVGVQYFDREKVKDDLRFLMANGAKTIKFLDRTFNISRSYAMEIFQFLIDEHVPGTVFQFEITADIMRPEVIEFLNQDAPKGLFRFEIGVQSTNDNTNKLVKRKQDFSKLTKIVTLIKKGGKIEQHLDLIAGLPEEDYTSFRKTFDDVFKLRPEEVQLGFLKMLHGTGLRLQAANWDYEYMDYSPYEILSNNTLSFTDVIKIKQVEDVLEKYWNDHRMDRTIDYIVSKVFVSPFDFFQEFGTFWDKQGWARIGHQLEDLFRRLDAFLQAKSIKDREIISGLMKYDYFKNHKYKPRKPWWETNIDKKKRSILYKLLLERPLILGQSFVNLQLDEKELYKHTMIEELSFDLQLFLETGIVERSPSCLVAYFDAAKEKTLMFSFKEEKPV
ncbi:B12-binding domain-containing radical SAM protein [Neobacillus sp. PS3-40]|uniref:B12-binding domain-containing radical SAM protein n=1 Tax=Neobacillus sp. PS3-40 TaxID=3070679 RepID=UPI0027E1EA00|nr:B12-binding domain-containing radical SAM protein [Neobacillus sp. PS3-40]WML43489.1 B12-binding domain-containing radical SAM protein [Neobacillus sp. PS3-40]